MLKLMFSKKATKIVKIFTVNLTFNVRSEKKNTKHSSNTLLRLVFFFLERTLICGLGEVTLFMKPTQQPQALQVVVVLLLLLKVCFFLHNLPE